MSCLLDSAADIYIENIEGLIRDQRKKSAQQHVSVRIFKGREQPCAIFMVF
jgi:hypothetical protein